MIAVIRIHGMTNMDRRLEDTLSRLRLRRKLVCVLIDEKDHIRMGMLNSVKEYVAFGKIDDALVKELVEKRGELKAENKGKKKSIETVKPFFRLHPPIGGFRKSTKQSVPKGILGKHEDISKLLLRML